MAGLHDKGEEVRAVSVGNCNLNPDAIVYDIGAGIELGQYRVCDTPDKG